jgi:hypothetical protein
MIGSLKISIKYIEIKATIPPITFKLGMKRNAKMKAVCRKKKT